MLQTHEQSMETSEFQPLISDKMAEHKVTFWSRRREELIIENSFTHWQPRSSNPLAGKWGLGQVHSQKDCQLQLLL
jgi:hypothetical protein